MILDFEKVQYSNWVELFENHACAYNVLDHIDPNTTRPTGISDAMWTRLDAIVKQWIYGTISTDLLQIVLSRNSTTQETWNRIKNIFQDNKNTTAVYLENQFNNLHLSHFPNVTAYCQQIKTISDQLANIDQPISDQKMVLHLAAGLAKTDFDTVATIIQQSDPLPSFTTARSRLLLEESRQSHESLPSTQSFIAHHETPSPTQPQTHNNFGGNNNHNNSGGSAYRGRNSHRGGGRGGRNNRGGRRGGGRHEGSNIQS